MLRALLIFLLLPVLGIAALLMLTAPKRLEQADIAGLVPDLAAGEQVFLAGGCASCHAAPDATRKSRLVLAGGRGFVSDFGTFYAPNISPDPVAGIGDWSALDLVNAMRFGTSPDGRHYYPAFPYITFQRTSLQDIVSLFAYLQTLPASDAPDRAHEVDFPFSIRAGIGLWKRLYQNEAWILPDVTSARLERGRYLVEALADCAACHTPRNKLGGLINSRWLGGARNPTGPGTVPNITPGALDWSALDIMVYLGTGTTPDYDTVGAQMAQVVENLSQLPASDLLAIAAYLKAIPAIK